MSIISTVEEMPGDLDAGTDGGSMVRSWTILFDENDSPQNRPLMAYQAPQIPYLYATHPYNGWMFVKNKTVRRMGPLSFRVICHYSVRPKSEAAEEQQNPMSNPLDEPWKIEWNFVSSNEAIDRDNTGKAITNSAGESFDPPITKDVHDQLLRITRNQAMYDKNQAFAYLNATNNDTFYGFEPGTVRCIIYRATAMRTGQFMYWEATFEFQIRRDGWLRRILDEGFRELTGTDDYGKPTYELIKDDNDTPVNQPVLLDGNGKKKIAAADAVFLEFDLDVKLPFSALGL